MSDVETLRDALERAFHDEPWFGHGTDATMCAAHGACGDILELVAPLLAQARADAAEKALKPIYPLTGNWRFPRWIADAIRAAPAASPDTESEAAGECAHDWTLRPESDTWVCEFCGDER